MGNPTVLPQCSEVDFFTQGQESNACPGDTAVGVAVVSFFEPSFVGPVTVAVPLFNLVPRQGEPARFGFTAEPGDVPVVLDTSVRAGGDYGVTVTVANTTEAVPLLGSQVTIWGVPGEAAHDASRGWECIDGGTYAASFGKPCAPLAQPQPPAFMTLPTSCT